MLTTATTATPGVRVVRDDAKLGQATVRRVSLRLLPFLCLLTLLNFRDRADVFRDGIGAGPAALEVSRDLHVSATAYGLATALMFLGYLLFVVPSTLAVARVGARRVIAAMLIVCGLAASATVLVHTPNQFYALRFLLGVAEAGFMPGIVYYLYQWFPATERAQAISRIGVAIPVSGVICPILTGWIVGLDGRLDLSGWQWLFVVEGIPAVILGIMVLALLTDRVEQAGWLRNEEREWLAARLARAEAAAPHDLPLHRIVSPPILWLIALASFLFTIAAYNYVARAPTIIRSALHTGTWATVAVTGALACLAVVATLAVGAHSDRTGERCLHVAGCAAVVAVGYSVTAIFVSPLATILGLSLVVLGSTAYLGPLWSLPAQFLSGTAAAAGIGFVSLVALAANFAAPYLARTIWDQTSLSWSQPFGLGPERCACCCPGRIGVVLLGLAVLGLATAALCVVLRKQVDLATHAVPRVVERDFEEEVWITSAVEPA